MDFSVPQHAFSVPPGSLPNHGREQQLHAVTSGTATTPFNRLLSLFSEQSSVSQAPWPPLAEAAKDSVPSIPPGAKLTAAQKKELEIAGARSEKARRGQKRRSPSEDGAAPAPEECGAALDDEDLDMSKLSPEERQQLANADSKEAKKLRRLLRNRCSAQQARERKKQYVGDLEAKVAAQDKRIAELEAKLAAAEQQNGALRRILRTMRPLEGAAPLQLPPVDAVRLREQAAALAAAAAAAGGQAAPAAADDAVVAVNAASPGADAASPVSAAAGSPGIAAAAAGSPGAGSPGAVGAAVAAPEAAASPGMSAGQGSGMQQAALAPSLMQLLKQQQQQQQHSRQDGQQNAGAVPTAAMAQCMAPTRQSSAGTSPRSPAEEGAEQMQAMRSQQPQPQLSLQQQLSLQAQASVPQPLMQQLPHQHQLQQQPPLPHQPSLQSQLSVQSQPRLSHQHHVPLESQMSMQSMPSSLPLLRQHSRQQQGPLASAPAHAQQAPGPQHAAAAEPDLGPFGVAYRASLEAAKQQEQFEQQQQQQQEQGPQHMLLAPRPTRDLQGPIPGHAQRDPSAIYGPGPLPVAVMPKSQLQQLLMQQQEQMLLAQRAQQSAAAQQQRQRQEASCSSYSHSQAGNSDIHAVPSGCPHSHGSHSARHCHHTQPFVPQAQQYAAPEQYMPPNEQYEQQYEQRYGVQQQQRKYGESGGVVQRSRSGRRAHEVVHVVPDVGAMSFTPGGAMPFSPDELLAALLGA